MKNNRQLIMRLIVLVISDMFIVIFSVICALLLSYDLKLSVLPEGSVKNLLLYLPVHIVLSLFVFFCFRLYHSLWKYASLPEAYLIGTSCVILTVAFFLVTRALSFNFRGSFYFLSFFLLLSMMLLSRFAYRLIRSLTSKYGINGRTVSTYNIMIIGAGKAGNMLIREFNSQKEKHKRVVCAIDDDPAKIGRYIQGVKIIGNRDEIIPTVRKYDIKEIIYTIPFSKPNVRAVILNICKQTGCVLKTLPNISQLLSDKVSLEHIRSVNIEDLLGREPVSVDLDSIMSYVRDKVVLVTGGGGSIGSELCRQIAMHSPKRLIIFDIYENNAYDIQMELIRRHPELDLVTLIGSVRDEGRIDSVFNEYRPQIVYHAAAHKHVPLMEKSLNEAIKNNVFGTRNVASASDKYGIERFILISTDKAVNPTNIMGASKRICEMIVQSYSNSSATAFTAVRFGNVLGSNGSVIPLFKKQIEDGGPVCVTHPDIIRYFMTVSEAVSLVLQAGAYARGGEIFVLDMGEPVRILDLAENLIRLSGFEPYKEIDIKFTGLRPGEKLYEELLMDEEGIKKTKNRQIYIGQPISFDEVEFFSELDELFVAVSNEEEDIRSLISKIVPTYRYISDNTGVREERTLNKSVKV